KKNKGDGFTLIEVTVAMALMAVAGIIAIEVLSKIRKTSEKTLRNNGHLELHAEMVKTLNQGITEFEGIELDENLFYSLNSSSEFERTSTVMDKKTLNEYVGADRKITSHRFRKRIDTDIVEYYSVCIPKDEVRDFEFENIHQLRSHDRWPFIKVIQNAYKVN